MDEAKADPSQCFHCHSPLPTSGAATLKVDDSERSFCCHGCAAAAEAISAAGLQSYYRQRQAPAPRAELPEDHLEQLSLYDHPSMQLRFVTGTDDECEANLMLEGVNCPACMWLIERRLGSEPGVLSTTVNYESERARVRWRKDDVALSRVMGVVQSLGYGVRPYDIDTARSQRDAAQSDLLKRLGVAGLFGMQAMLLAVAVYLGEWSGIEDEHRTFMNWVGGLVTLPVFFYSGAPFFKGAKRALQSGQITMDVPVSLGLIAALIASAISLASNEGPVYFDSIAMFCFFLLTARYVERRLGSRAVDVADRLSTALPVLAQRLDDQDQMETVATAELLVGDRLQVPAGETIPADAVILSGESAVDESLLTGESIPRPVVSGDAVVAGSVNAAQTLIIRATTVGEQSTLSQLARLLDRASAAKPPLAEWAGRVAARFSAFVLLVAAGTAAFWLWRDPAQAWHATIAVLVVSCPCALALAVPSAISNATSALARRGVLLLRAGAMQGLASVKHAVFDKTGTLTKGKLSVAKVTLAESVDDQWIAATVLALESGSSHPIARALWSWAGDREVLPTALHGDLQHQPGRGVEANTDRGLVCLGTADYLHSHGVEVPVHWLEAGEDSLALLSCGDRALACFYLQDQPREQAAQSMQQMRDAGLTLHLYSGDRAAAVTSMAKIVGIEDYAAELKPEQKLEKVQALQQDGGVLMVGDGLNDAASLAGATVSVAMGTGAAMALQNSDAVLTSDDLSALSLAVQQSRRAHRVVWQNIGWALCYNALAMPLAASGWLQPWMAAIGMSASSLIVVLNAARLQRL